MRFHNIQDKQELVQELKPLPNPIEISGAEHDLKTQDLLYNLERISDYLLMEGDGLFRSVFWAEYIVKEYCKVNER